MPKSPFLHPPFEFERLRGLWWVFIIVCIAVCLKWPIVLLFLVLLRWRDFGPGIVWSMTGRLKRNG
ncbi:MAG: hypothetical protein R3C19_12215 [Planctomycetaceae bacterium]